MAFDVIQSFQNIAKEYKRYLKTVFDIADPDYKKMFHNALENDAYFEKYGKNYCYDLRVAKNNKH